MRFTFYVHGRHVQLMTFQLRWEAFSHIEYILGTREQVQLEMFS